MSRRRRLQIAVSGSFKDYTCNPYTILGHHVAQRILPLINEKPMAIEELSAELDLPEDMIKEHIEKMLSCRYVEEVQADSKTLYKPAFTILTLEDQRRLQPLIEELSSDIATVVAESMPKVREAIKQVRCIKAGYELPQTEYIVVVAYTLNLLASKALRDEGYVIEYKDMPGGSFIVSALEEGLVDLEDEWTWGNFDQYGEYVFASYGKAEIPWKVRSVFPDIAWFWKRVVGQSKVNKWVERIGDILFELIDGSLPIRELASRLQIDEIDLIRDLHILDDLEYVSIVGSGENTRVELAAPIFSRSDIKLIREAAKAICQGVVATLREKYSKIEDTYSKLSPARNGIDLSEALNAIYMLTRIMASRKLIEMEVVKKPPIRRDGEEYTTWVAKVPWQDHL
ncbi:MAG: hypothetical protein DRN96_09700 [Thermoproteota archaeon]|nr:MAG: hypothetical protein DRN96_09700 [Candidatus Korarchaeota archaeon]